MRTKWFHQRKGWGLGNFVMCTPALQMMNEINRERINVFFDDSSIADLFKKCQFLNILKKKPSNSPFANSVRPKRICPEETNSEALCRILCGCSDNIPGTYVDNIDCDFFPKKEEKAYVAIFHGCLSDKKPRRIKKDIGADFRQEILDCVQSYGMIPVILGSKGDKIFWDQNDLRKVEHNFIDRLSLKDSVGVLNKCDFFISNDTGLYHVSGALKKKGIVLWKDTDMVRNRSTFDGILHCDIKRSDSDSITSIIRGFSFENRV